MSLRSDKEGLEFTEIMSGHIHIGAEIDDFETAQRIAKGNCEQARFFLSVHAYDTHTLLASEDHKAMLTGTFTSGALPASPYMVTGGRFYLFRNDARAPEAKNLEYDFDMVGTDGSKIHFNGYKVINDMAAFSIRRIWGATTTLRVTLSTPTEDEEEEGRERVIGKGILFINPHDFIRELRSFYASLNSASQFVGFFARNLAKVFFAPFDHLDRPEYAYEAWHARNAPTHDFPVHASDGVKSRMMIWDPLSTERKHMDLLFIGGAAVDESIFALPTIKHNAIYHFRKQGYRCFCVVHRVGNCQNAQGKWTTYDARLDIAEAIKKIGRLRQSRKYGQLASKIYVIAHCAGAVALSAGILNNDIDTSSIAGMTISQVFMTPKFAMINRWKASIPLATNTYSALSKSDWYDCSSHPKDAYFQLILNQLLRLYPVRRKNLCNSVVCHRSSFIFGLLWSHQNLNDATHRTLHRFLGGTTMMNERHLIQMCNKGHVLRSDGTDDLVTAKNIERFRGIPVLFLCGAENGVYDPENLLTSFSTLRRQLEVSDYELERFDDFGHLDLWMSERSAEEIYPRVDDHLATVLERMKDQGVNGFAANGRADQRR